MSVPASMKTWLQAVLTRPTFFFGTGDSVACFSCRLMTLMWPHSEDVDLKSYYWVILVTIKCMCTHNITRFLRGCKKILIGEQRRKVRVSSKHALVINAAVLMELAEFTIAVTCSVHHDQMAKLFWLASDKKARLLTKKAYRRCKGVFHQPLTMLVAGSGHIGQCMIIAFSGRWERYLLLIS